MHIFPLKRLKNFNQLIPVGLAASIQLVYVDSVNNTYCTNPNAITNNNRYNYYVFIYITHDLTN